MSAIEPQKTPIRPWNCVEEAWRLVKDQYWLFFGVVLVGALIGGAVPVVLLGPMMCGIYLCYIQRHHNKPVEFGLLFKGFDFFVESLLATLIMVGVALVVIIPAYLIFGIAIVGLMAGTQGEPPPAAVFGLFFMLYVVIIVLMIVVTLPFIFVFPLIADRGLKAVPAVKASCRGVLANAFGILGMMLLTGGQLIYS